MENTYKKGYISEKILNAFIGGTVPIYYGHEDVLAYSTEKLLFISIVLTL